MAVATSDFIEVVNTDRHHLAGYDVLLGPVTVDALKIVAAHVNIDSIRRFGQRTIQVAMLDGVAAASIEVAPAAIVSGRQTNAFGRG